MKNKKREDTKYVHFYNANPEEKRTGDCVIRAISVATEKTWDSILDALVEVAHREKSVPNNEDCYIKYLEENGFVRCKQPRKEDNTRYRGWEFLEKIKKSDIIVAHMGTRHLSAIKNKKFWDTWDCSNDCVGIYWIKNNKKEK